MALLKEKWIDLSHNKTKYRDAIDCHPSTSISFLPTITLTETNIQKAVEVIDSRVTSLESVILPFEWKSQKIIISDITLKNFSFDFNPVIGSEFIILNGITLDNDIDSGDYSILNNQLLLNPTIDLNIGDKLIIRYMKLI